MGKERGGAAAGDTSYERRPRLDGAEGAEASGRRRPFELQNPGIKKS